jgi:hypothetical protein
MESNRNLLRKNKMASQFINASILSAGIAIGTTGTVATQQASADKILYVKKENTKLKVANFTQMEPNKWVMVVCGVMHDNDGGAFPETCHQCEAKFPATQADFLACHSKGEGLE